MTAEELIAQERVEQMTKHHYLISDDYRNYRKGELLEVAMCIQTKEPYGWPKSWDREHFNHYMNKDRKGQLIVAGALVMAHTDAFGSNPATDELLEDIIKELNDLLSTVG